MKKESLVTSHWSLVIGHWLLVISYIMSPGMTTIRFVCSEDFSPSIIRTKVLTTNLFFIIVIDRT
jgi:hypothetical protein